MRKPFTVVVATAALSLACLLNARPSSAIDIGLSITVAPPVLPVYVQPEIPAPGYIWTPGYWAWGDGGYYWVPGTWVEPPSPGLLWTPGYWGWEGGAYLWHAGYWGPTIGFYGGVNYGFGYFGHGYAGGYWDRGVFRYNTAYNRFGGGVHITNVYNRTVNNIPGNRVSYNGGAHGIQTRANARELAAQHERRTDPIAAQMRQAQMARDNPALRASQNHGRPGIAATARPGDFQGRVEAAHGFTAAPHGSPQTRPRPPQQTFHTPAPMNHAPNAPRPPAQNFEQRQRFQQQPQQRVQPQQPRPQQNFRGPAAQQHGQPGAQAPRQREDHHDQDQDHR